MTSLRQRFLFSILFGASLLSCRHDAADLLFDKKIIAPTIPEVINVTASNPNGAYATGSPVHIQVVFNTNVIVTGSPQLQLSTGNPVTTNINYVSGSGTSTLNFDYTVIITNSSPDLDYTSTAALLLNGGTITGTNGITAILTLPAPGAARSLGANKNIVIDPNAAQITMVSASTGNGTYGAGTSILVTVTFNAIVDVDTTGGIPRIPMEVVTANTYANYTGGTGTMVLTFTYVIDPGNSSADLNYPSGANIDLNGGTILKNSNGTVADLTLRPHGSSSLGDNRNIVIDGIVPLITGVTSSTGNGSYTIGATIVIEITFSKNITLGGIPVLTLNSGAAVNCSSATGAVLTCNYTVGATQNSGDLDFASTTALNPAGTITDVLGNTANRTLPTPGGTGSIAIGKAIVVDTTAPTISSVNSSTSDGTYGIGSVVSIQVVFSESVTVTGTATLTLNSGGSATCTACSGSTLNFTYTIVNTNSSPDLDYLSTGSLTGTIQDGVGIAATLTLPALSPKGTLATAKAIVIDGVRPTIVSMSSSKANTSTSTFLFGASFDIVIVFSENVSVTGANPTLALSTGGTATYAGGSGTTSLTFTYNAPGLTSANPLDYTATGLTGGTIRDLVNDADRALPAPGLGTSFLHALSIVITAI